MSAPRGEGPRVVVVGRAQVSAPPDSAEVTLTVDARDRSRERALVLLADRQREVRELLRRHGGVVSDSSTEALWVQPEHDEDGRGRVRAHLASMSTRVHLDDADAVGALVTEAAGLPTVTVAGLQWLLSPGAPAHTEVRALALGDAVDRARDYAAALGSVLTGLVEVRDVAAGGHRMAVMATMSSGSAPDLDVEPARQDVHGQVEVTVTMAPVDPAVLAGGTFPPP